MDYNSFLLSKTKPKTFGTFEMAQYPFLYDFQKRLMSRISRTGRAAVFADCGLGKTPIQLCWADSCARSSEMPVLIFTPLAVAQQTKYEADKFGIDARIVSDASEIQEGVNITNYHKLHKFNPNKIGGVVLDESSILKNYNGKYRTALTDFAANIPFRLCCTATPSPNDIAEIINHAEFLGVMTGKEMLALFFIQDGNTTHKWRVKGHAEKPLYDWMRTWAVAARCPADLGCPDKRFHLPKLHIVRHTLEAGATDGFLFPVEAQTLDERRQARTDSIEERCELAAQIVNNSTEPWVIWTGRNAEGELLRKMIPDSVDVKGGDDDEVRVDRMIGFSLGKYRVLITKPSIAGFGMNWQHCNSMVFVGLSDSFEQYYQAVRRCWRFGQTREVTAHIVTTETEGAVVENIKNKERQASEMIDKLVQKGAQK